MTGSARRRAIEAAIRKDGEVTIAALAEKHSVSEMTIRRDLEALEISGSVRRVRGGAISTVSRSYEPPLTHRLVDNAEAKKAIGAAAANLLSPGETAILDVGTSTLEMAKRLHGHRGNTIVTPSLMVAMELGGNPNLRVLVTGGVVRPGEMSLIGPPAEDAFNDVNCDVVFLGVAGVDPDSGLTEYSLEDTRVKRAALKAARRAVVLADESKLGRVAFSHVAPISVVDTLVTDAAPTHPVVVALRDMGTTIVHAN
ncbi:MAG: DeoR/GlpR family DNA-binding transcription regulator [Actinobacteria bacterium]|nr:DeoR/GlpR family DNA-binding transcription regulator [Actinomycetota bacterium]